MESQSQENSLEVKNKNLKCKRCRSGVLEIVVQTFKDKTEHHRIDCVTCGAFNGYQAQNTKEKKIFDLHFALQRMLDAFDVEQEAGPSCAIAIARETIKKYGRVESE